MADFAPSELNLDERRVRNIVMEKAILKQYGKSIDDVYNDYFKPAIANIELTAPHTSLNRPIPPPKEDDNIKACSSSIPNSEEKVRKTDWAQL